MFFLSTSASKLCYSSVNHNGDCVNPMSQYRVLWSHSVAKGRVGSLERELPKGGAGLELACLQ